ncbi:MAG: putative DNA binding domain-containing protein [Lachnospiraceae bacterium]|nr:putative DNA binding domain-containing protein [Lachnospiraceae bacterium]
MVIESENLEFKREFTEEIYKEVVAFANTDGGTVYVGIDNEGNVVGLSDVDEEYVRITNGIRDAIEPDVTMFVRYTIQENRVVRINVSEGTNKSFYLKGKGLKPGGVYVRQGSTSVPASFDAIRRMIRESDGDVFENMKSLQQELSFEYAQDAFRRCGIVLEKSKYQTLGITESGVCGYTKLGMLLSDQCEHTIKIAVFEDEGKRVFRDQREFGGSVLKQLEETLEYLRLCNRTEAKIQGLKRIESPEYPEEAIREAILNAIIHRDYSYSGSVMVNVYDSCMEVISLGGLLPGLEPEDIKTGISVLRNRKLAEVFHRLKLVEAYGTGIGRIFSLYEDCPEQPQIKLTANTFKIILPNRNAARDKACASYDTAGLQARRVREENAVYGSVSAHPGPYGSYREVGKPLFVTRQMSRILAYVDEYGKVTDEEIGRLLSVKKTRAFTIAKQMRDGGLLRAEGRGEERRYVKA